MSGKCAEIALSQAVAGMMLFDDLIDANGKVLLPGGTTLSESTLNSLRRRDIEILRVNDDNADPGVELLAEKNRALQL